MSRGVGGSLSRGMGSSVNRGVDGGVSRGVGGGLQRGVGSGVSRGVGGGLQRGVGSGVNRGVGGGMSRGMGGGVNGGVSRGESSGLQAAESASGENGASAPEVVLPAYPGLKRPLIGHLSTGLKLAAFSRRSGSAKGAQHETSSESFSLVRAFLIQCLRPSFPGKGFRERTPSARLNSDSPALAKAGRPRRCVRVDAEAPRGSDERGLCGVPYLE